MYYMIYVCFVSKKPIKMDPIYYFIYKSNHKYLYRYTFYKKFYKKYFYKFYET